MYNNIIVQVALLASLVSGYCPLICLCEQSGSCSSLVAPRSIEFSPPFTSAQPGAQCSARHFSLHCRHRCA